MFCLLTAVNTPWTVSRWKRIFYAYRVESWNLSNLFLLLLLLFSQIHKYSTLLHSFQSSQMVLNNLPFNQTLIPIQILQLIPALRPTMIKLLQAQQVQMLLWLQLVNLEMEMEMEMGLLDWMQRLSLVLLSDLESLLQLWFKGLNKWSLGFQLSASIFSLVPRLQTWTIILDQQPQKNLVSSLFVPPPPFCFLQTPSFTFSFLLYPIPKNIAHTLNIH